MLPYWEPDLTIDPDARARWRTHAYRIALGVELVAHLEPIVDEERLRVGFCLRSEAMAGLLRDAILKENIGAEVFRAHPGMAQEEACDIVLTCRPDGDEEEVKHAVVASTKAAHLYLCARPVT